MKIDIEFAELHSPLFFLGKNFGMKLDHAKYPEITLTYDSDPDWLVVGWKGRVTFVPTPNVANMTPREKKGAAKVAELKPGRVVVEPSLSAQVETPTSHVFAGEGKGKSR